MAMILTQWICFCYLNGTARASRKAAALPAWPFFLALFLSFVLFVSFSPSFSFCLYSFLSRSLSLCPVEDVANLTASDVMNRVNLGYLQGNSYYSYSVRHIYQVVSLFDMVEWSLFGRHLWQIIVTSCEQCFGGGFGREGGWFKVIMKPLYG